MPVHISNNTAMAPENGGRLNGRVGLTVGVDIPEADCGIFGCSKHFSGLDRIPGEAKTRTGFQETYFSVVG